MRKGNPKGIKDWDDLARPGVAVITPNPKTSGGARWNYLAAWGYALRKPGGDAAKAKDFVARLYKNVPVLDTGARGSTITFVERGIGDVLIAWENEALLAVKRAGRQGQVRDRRAVASASSPSRRSRWSTRWSTSTARAQVAKAYLEYLYTAEGQEIAAKHYYRPRNAGGRRRSTRRSSRSSSCSPSTRSSAAGPRRRRRTSPTAASSTRSTAPEVTAHVERRRARRRRARASAAAASCPASAWRSASRSLYLGLIVLIPLVDRLPEDGDRWPGPPSGRRSPRRGRSPPTS